MIYKSLKELYIRKKTSWFDSLKSASYILLTEKIEDCIYNIASVNEKSNVFMVSISYLKLSGTVFSSSIYICSSEGLKSDKLISFYME